MFWMQIRAKHRCDSKLTWEAHPVLGFGFLNKNLPENLIFPAFSATEQMRQMSSSLQFSMAHLLLKHRSGGLRVKWWKRKMVLLLLTLQISHFLEIMLWLLWMCPCVSRFYIAPQQLRMMLHVAFELIRTLVISITTVPPAVIHSRANFSLKVPVTSLPSSWGLPTQNLKRRVKCPPFTP